MDFIAINYAKSRNQHGRPKRCESSTFLGLIAGEKRVRPQRADCGNRRRRERTSERERERERLAFYRNLIGTASQERRNGNSSCANGTLRNGRRGRNRRGKQRKEDGKEHKGDM